MIVFFIVLSERLGLNFASVSWRLICAGMELAVCGEGVGEYGKVRMRKFTCILANTRNTDEYEDVRSVTTLQGVSN